jgi:alcohol dehydrogenase (cytochrome c)
VPYPNESGALATAGGLVVTALLDGTLLAFDDQTLAELWRINLGTGINAPPVTFAVDGKQYIAIATGLSGPARGKLSKTPELKNFPQSTMVFVFGL